jgi:hypothetical protein
LNVVEMTCFFFVFTFFAVLFLRPIVNKCAAHCPGTKIELVRTNEPYECVVYLRTAPVFRCASLVIAS